MKTLEIVKELPLVPIEKMKEFIGLLWLNLVVSVKNIWDFLCVAIRYYRHKKFFLADVSLRLIYLFDSPFRMSRKFLEERKELELYQYGETSLCTLERIMRLAGVTKKDTVMEMGSGRGRTCFWLSQVLGCQTIGVEYLPEFVARANQVKHKLRLERLEFRLQDFVEVDLEGVSVVYLYGTCLEEVTIHKLIDRFKTMPAGTKVITVSFPLTHYDKTHAFEVMRCFKQSFTWGSSDVYVQMVR